MLEQRRLIERVRRQCLADRRLEAALTYGSFAQGSGDAHSDIEFWLFFAPTADQVDSRRWCADIAPLAHLTTNEFGTRVAFFPGLLRGEFHFAGSAGIDGVRSWPARGAAVEDMVIVDRTGALTEALSAVPEQPELPRTAEEIERLCGQFANWLVLAHHVAARGEHLRALDALAHSRRCLLWMARLSTGHTTHWLTPSRWAEADLPADVLAEIGATTTMAEPERIAAAIRASWSAGRRHWHRLGDRYGSPVPAALCAELDSRLGSP